MDKPSMASFENLDELTKRILKSLLYVGSAWGAWRFIITPAYEKYQLKQANEKVFSDPNVQLASLLRQAIIGAGTNEKLIMKVAQRITNYKAVQDAYQKLTGNNLNQDLYKDLSAKDYSRFMEIVGQKLKATSSTSKRGYLVVSSRDVRLRSTPDSSKGAFSLNSNILDTAPIAKFLGFATGTYKVDSKGVLYYQVRIKYLQSIPSYHKETSEEQKSKTLSFWVGSGAIQFFRDFKQMRATYPSLIIYPGTKDTGLRQALQL